MNREDLQEYLKHIESFTDEEKRKRDLYLKRIGPRPNVEEYTDEQLKEKEKIATKKIPDGKIIQGPTLGIPEIDKPWLQFFDDKDILEELPDMTIVDYIFECNKDNMEGIFAEYFDKKFTYQDLKNKVEEAKAALIAKGIKPYDGTGERTRIGLALPTMPETFYLFLAIVDLGCVATMIDPRINEERIKDCIEESKCELLFNIDKFNPKFEKVVQDLGMVDKLIPISGANSLSKTMKFLYKTSKKIKPIKGCQTYDDFIDKGKEIDATNIHGKYEANDPAVLEFTSGTTSKPKGAYLSNKNLIGIAAQEKTAFPDKKKGDKFLDIMPPFITYGLGCGMCAVLSEGLNLRLIPEFKPENFAKLIMKYKPQHVIGVPSHYEMLIKDKKLQNADLSFLKYCIAGGDKMPTTVETKINEFFEKHGINNRIIKGYGMTELSSVAAVNLNNDSNKLGTTGVPFPKNNIKILDPETKERKRIGEFGEVYESGPTVMLGYMNNPEMDHEIFIEDENGKVWVKTGDRGKIDEDGLITIEGRYKDTIVRSDGHNVRPTPIEEIINLHPGVEKCVVIGMPNPELESGEIPTACIVIKEDYDDDISKLIEEVNEMSLEKLPPRDIALAYEIVEEIPMTSVGKTNLKALKETLINKNKNMKR